MKGHREGGGVREDLGVEPCSITSVVRPFFLWLLNWFSFVCVLDGDVPPTQNRAPQRLQGVAGGAGLNPEDTELAAVIALPLVGSLLFFLFSWKTRWSTSKHNPSPWQERRRPGLSAASGEHGPHGHDNDSAVLRIYCCRDLQTETRRDQSG